MRAIGASRRQILAAVLLEALGVGVAASLLGLATGVLVAGGLKVVLVALGFEFPAGGIVFTVGTAVTALTAGIGVTVLAAFAPARRAGKVPPIAAMRGITSSSTGYGSKRRILVGTGILAVGVGVLCFGLFASPDNALSLVGAGALAVFFGVAALGRTMSRSLSRVLGWPLPRLRGITGLLARENAMRNPKRTAATASALMIGVGLVGFITILAASTKASFSETIDKAYTGDLMVTGSAAWGMGGIDPALADRARRLPEVAGVAQLRGGFAAIDGSPAEIGAISREGFDLFDVEPIAGSPADLDAHSIAVHRDTAREKHLGIGDPVPVIFKDTGPQTLRVGLIYGELQPAGKWILPLAAHEANFADRFDYQVFIRKAPGVTTAAALAAVKSVGAGFPGAAVHDQASYKAEQTQFVDQMLSLVYALLALAIFIALLGIGNTLALSILERTRELGVMRAVGMTRSQLRSAIRWEAVLIALQGTLLGLVIGVFFGWVMVRALQDQGLVAFTIPVARLGIIVVLAALAGVAAAVLPARRAARLNVLRAVTAE